MKAIVCDVRRALAGRWFWAALLAPTEILARQHYENLSPLLERFGISCALLTVSTKV